jgi:nitroreductase
MRRNNPAEASAGLTEISNYQRRNMMNRKLFSVVPPSLKLWRTSILVLVGLFVISAQILAEDANSVSASAKATTDESAKDVNAIAAQELKPIELPKPQTDGGKPLMQVLKERKTSREFSGEKLPMQVLSNLLWAGNGINRPDGKRTAPTAMNKQEIDVYVAMAEGLYLYDAKANTLIGILAEDVRAATGTQPFVKDAPVNLVFVADFSKMGNGPDEQKQFYAAADTGYVSQNVYLYCASEDLATVVRGSVDKPALAAIMKLPDNKKIILAQTVGYPKK